MFGRGRRLEEKLDRLLQTQEELLRAVGASAPAEDGEEAGQGGKKAEQEEKLRQGIENILNYAGPKGRDNNG